MVNDSFLFCVLVSTLDSFPDHESKGQLNGIGTRILFLSRLSDFIFKKCFNIYAFLSAPTMA